MMIIKNNIDADEIIIQYQDLGNEDGYYGYIL